MGVLEMMALPFGVYITAPGFWKLSVDPFKPRVLIVVGLADLGQVGELLQLLVDGLEACREVS